MKRIKSGGGGLDLTSKQRIKAPPPRSDDYDDYIWRGTKFINYQIKLSAKEYNV